MNIQTNGEWINNALSDASKYDVKPIKVCVYCEKDKHANPYYVSNVRLCKCSRAVLEIFDFYSPKEDTSADTNKTNSEYFNNNNVFRLENVSGGHRNTMENDTEIKFSALLRPSAPVDEFIETVREICEKHEVCYKIY